ncbi:MAG: hypothetical protein HJJLKODD_00068 [Phycisphaerae bacterium]|nr:hypothetical protein [Phycisphaerae bacterium]
MAGEQTKNCQSCGASIYPEHLTTHKAGYWGGKLLCVHCYAEKQGQQVTIGSEDVVSGESAAHHPLDMEGVSILRDSIDAAGDAPHPEDQKHGADAPAIQIASLTSSMIKPFGGGHDASGDKPAMRFRRFLQHDDSGALRCRIFHAKLNDGALQFMENQINEWVDTSPEVDIKHISTQIGLFEGKHTETHLIITVFY